MILSWVTHTETYSNVSMCSSAKLKETLQMLAFSPQNNTSLVHLLRMIAIICFSRTLEDSEFYKKHIFGISVLYLVDRL